MIVSACCKEIVGVHCADEGTAFYFCKACDKACDTISPLDFPPLMEQIDAEV